MTTATIAPTDVETTKCWLTIPLHVTYSILLDELPESITGDEILDIAIARKAWEDGSLNDISRRDVYDQVKSAILSKDESISLD